MRTLSGVISVFFISVVVGACSSTPENGDGGTDASSDVKPDKVANDSGVDAATCGSKLACEVCDGNFTATQMTAPFANAGLCSAADITAFVTACGASSTQATCDAWQTAEGTSAPDCLSCVFSDQAGPKWGLYVCDSQGACTFNTPGCLDVALGTVSLEKQAGGAGSCGDLYNDAYGCESYSCGACTTTSDYDTCLTSADANQCKAYADPAYSTTGKCAALDDASVTVNSCFGANDSDLTTMVTILCGGPMTTDGGTSDAGTNDAASDAATD
jgi:hypothetical protein